MENEKQESKTFEDELERLEEIGELLKDGSVGLETAARLFQEGITLSKKLDAELSGMERRIELVVNEENETVP